MRNAIVHPVHLGVVALLVVNDHVLKYLWPGTVTGKLSDVAGVFVIAVVAAVLMGNRPAGLLAAGLGFTAIKTSSTAAALAAPVLGGVTLQDPTDLLALWALVPAAYHLRRFDESTVGDGDSVATERSRGWMRLAVVVSGTATVLTVTATSCIPWPRVHGFIVQPDGVVAVGDDVDHLSADGGRTWASIEKVDVSETVLTDQTESCLSDGRCFRVVEEVAVEELIDGRWETAFAYDEDELDAIDYVTESCTGRNSIRRTFNSLAVVDSADGDVVLVSMASQGILRLDPISQSWSAIAVGEAAPPDLNPPPSTAFQTVVYGAPFLLLAVSPFLLLVRFATTSLARRVTATALAACGGGVLLGLLFFFTLGGTGPRQFLAARVISVVALVIFALALWVALSGSADGAQSKRDREIDPPPPPSPNQPRPQAF